MNTRRHAARGESNWLLAALPDSTYRRISAASETVSLDHKEVLFEADAPIDYAHFPQSGCLSMITVMDDGTCVEVGTIGFEGMSDVALVHQVDNVPTKCIVQVEGEAKRVPRAIFLAEMESSPELSSVMHRYAQVWTDQVGRAGACNAVHSIEERCARWLAMTHDRTDSDVLPLTQDFLAIMLGVRRASVTLAASTLQKAGLIDYTRGKITVRDREGLVAAACDCYPAIQMAYDRRFPDDSNARA
ncbi:MAG TPA: Crp/Fnr family transcriptional regulator [Gemmatimonadaceae bacterium]|jgi:CRP-like cAMP-binding protein